MKKLSHLVGGFVAAATFSTAALADEPRVLSIASWGPPSHVTNAQIWPDFIERLEEVSGGALTAELKLNLVPVPASADFVLDGGADFTMIFHGYTPGRFPTAELVELPGTQGSVAGASAAYWRVWSEYLAPYAKQDEFKTAAMFVHGPGQLQMADPIADLAALSGQKVRGPGGIGSEMLTELGAVPVQVPITKTYEALSSGAADGLVTNVDTRTAFRLDDVTTQVYVVPGGLYRGSMAILMNKDTWNSLPADLQEKLDAELLGETLSKMFGAGLEAGDQFALESTKGVGHAVVEASEADLALVSTVAEKIEERVIERVSASGADAAAALDAFRALSVELD